MPQNISPFWKERIESHLGTIRALLDDESLLMNLQKAASLAIEAFKNNRAIYVCGNGGSAADAQHFAAELVGRFYKERRPFNAEALTVNTSTITALANDYGYDEIFSRQIEAKGQRGDLLIGISTSGNSPNVIKALTKAKEMGLLTVGLTGQSKNTELTKRAHVVIHAPTVETPRIQEVHILLIHLLCEYLEAQLTA